jgi:hypothetical protein
MFTLKLIKATGTQVKKSPIGRVVLERCFDEGVDTMHNLKVHIISI